ncbi:MAG TPA: hypothetical protein VLZ83_07870 [Edaphocola sp.]|nr:hypothetical protein [Edaphocola sp.]
MKKLTLQSQLQKSILFLETQRANEEMLLKAELKATIESLNPLNLIKSGVGEFIKSPYLKENVLDASLSLAAGFLSKKIIFGNSQSHVKQVFGDLLQASVTSVFSKNVDAIKSFTKGLADKFLLKNNYKTS